MLHCHGVLNDYQTVKPKIMQSVYLHMCKKAAKKVLNMFYCVYKNKLISINK